MPMLPGRVLWLRWVSRNNLSCIIQALNFQVAAASDRIVLLPVNRENVCPACSSFSDKKLY